MADIEEDIRKGEHAERLFFLQRIILGMDWRSSWLSSCNKMGRYRYDP